MTQPEKIESITLDSPLSITVAKAALAACDSSSLKGEIHDRLGMVSDALDHIESIASEADFHHIDLSFRSLYGVMRLVNRELKVIDTLFEALLSHKED
ncbi:MAG: hypothetical protein EKK71_15190 [Candidatus Competibacteraceae bacterium]|nr:MAG: hypothetical protein EKK71_15190 [Candidatus Competibacteraceae bacterium]